MKKEETYRRSAEGRDHPSNLSPAYKSTVSRSPSKSAIVLPHTLSEITGPLLREERLDAGENDLTRRRMGEYAAKMLDWRLGFAERSLTGYRATPRGLEVRAA